MLIRNDVLHYEEPVPHTVRILWVDAAGEVAYTFRLKAQGALPQPARMRMLEADVRSGRARLLLLDPCVARCPRTPPAKYLQIQARAWEIVGPMVHDEPTIFRQRERARMVAWAAAVHGVSRPTVMRYLRRYWERAQTVDALLPDYGNSGARGKTRAASADVKRGRPRKDGIHVGLNADDKVRATFRAAVDRYWATHDRFSRRAAYRQIQRPRSPCRPNLRPVQLLDRKGRARQPRVSLPSNPVQRAGHSGAFGTGPPPSFHDTARPRPRCA
jgi:hypothetical protein